MAKWNELEILNFGRQKVKLFVAVVSRESSNYRITQSIKCDERNALLLVKIAF